MVKKDIKSDETKKTDIPMSRKVVKVTKRIQRRKKKKDLKKLVKNLGPDDLEQV